MEHINWIYDMIPNMIKIIFILFFSSIIISLFLYIIAKLLKIFHISKHFKFYKHIYGIYIFLLNPCGCDSIFNFYDKDFSIHPCMFKVISFTFTLHMFIFIKNKVCNIFNTSFMVF